MGNTMQVTAQTSAEIRFEKNPNTAPWFQVNGASGMGGVGAQGYVCGVPPHLTIGHIYACIQNGMIRQAKENRLAVVGAAYRITAKLNYMQHKGNNLVANDNRIISSVMEDRDILNLSSTSTMSTAACECCLPNAEEQKEIPMPSNPPPPAAAGATGGGGGGQPTKTDPTVTQVMPAANAPPPQ